MRAPFTLLISLACVSVTLADFDGLPDAAKSRLGAVQKYPRASCVLLWVSESYTLAADGAQSYERHEFRWIPDEAARDNFGDPHVAYEEGRQRLDILAARTHTRDGRRIDATPHNAFNSIVPENGLDKAPDYSGYRQMVITLLGLENGCVAELHYRLTTTKPHWPWLEGRVYFREEWPVISRTLTVELPAGQSLIYTSDRGAPDPVVSGSRYTWTMGEMAGYLREDLQGHRVLLPNVAFTSATDWPQVTGEFSKRLAAAMTGEIATPPSLAKELASTTSGEARLEAIQTWVRERFNRLEFDHPDFGARLRPVERILQSGYGNSLELAALVAKLASAEDASVQVVPWILPDAPVPSLHDFAGALLSVKSDNVHFYCDPVEPRAEFTQANLLGGQIIALDRGSVQPEEFRCKAKSPHVSLTIALDDLTADTLRGRGTLSAYGEWGIYEKLRATDAAEYLCEFVHLAGLAVDKAQIKELEPARVAARAVVDFEFHANAPDTADGRRILALAALDFAAFVPEVPLMLTTREFSQWIPLPGEISLHVECPVPDTWAIERKPKTGSQVWDWSKGETHCNRVNNRLIFTRKLTLAREWIAPEGWPGFRAWVLEAGARPANSVVFSQ